MSVTLTAVSQLPCFENIEVVAGRVGVQEKNVTGITVIEAPDIADWIKGGELLLTSLYNFHDDVERQRKMIAKLAENGASGLIVKISRFVKKVPEVIIEEGNRHNLPILRLPGEVKYIDIMYPVMSELFNHQLVILEHYKNCHDQFIDIAVHGGSLDDIAAKLSGIISHPVIIYDQDFKILASSTEHYAGILSSPQLLENLQTSRNLDFYRERVELKGDDATFETTFVTTPVTVLDYTTAFIAVAEMDEPLDELDLVAIETSASNLSLVLAKNRAVDEIQYRFKNDIIDDLINGRYTSTTDIAQRAAAVGWDLNAPHVMILVQLHDMEQVFSGENGVFQAKEFIYRILMVIKSTAIHYSKSMIFISKSDRILTLFPSGKAKPSTIRRFADELQQNIKAQFENLSMTIGVGTETRQIGDIPDSYREACDAAAFGHMFHGDGAVIQYDELGVNRLLYQYQDPEELKKFIPSSLMKLRNYDIEKNNALTKTLEVYLSHNANAKKTAEELFIHYKTVQYRISRIKDIMGVNFEDKKYRLDTDMGLRILTLLDLLDKKN